MAFCGSGECRTELGPALAIDNSTSCVRRGPRHVRDATTLETGKPRCVALVEKLTFADVAPHHGHAAVARLLHDVALGRAAGGGRGGQACPQAVTSKQLRVLADGHNAALHD